MKKTFLIIFVAISIFGIINACSNEETIEETTVEETEEVIEEPVEEPIEEPIEEEPIVEEPVVETEPVEEPVEESGADLLTYTTNMSDYMFELENIMAELSSLIINGGSNPNLLFDDNWNIDVATQLVELQSVIDNIKYESVPSGMNDVHDKILDAMNEYQYMIDTLPVAIDTMDSDLFNACSNALNTGNAYLAEANDLIMQ